MEEEGRKEEQRVEYGSAERIDEGFYRLGRFEVIVGAGVILRAEDRETGVPVTFNLSPGESLQLVDLVVEHQDEITQYLFGEEQARSWDPVHIRTDEGPEQIPTNSSVKKRGSDESEPRT